MRELFEDILARLKALTNEADEPLLRYINWDFGQLSEPAPPVSYPCALIDINAISESSAGEGCMLHVLEVRITIAHKVHERATNLVTATQLSNALAHLDINRAVDLAINHSSGEMYTPLVRTGYSRTPLPDPLAYELTYTTELSDYGYADTLIPTTPPPPDFDVSI